MSDEARRKERLQERSLAISAIQSNYSDLMKLLITLSSTCLTFTITLLKDNDVGVGGVYCVVRMGDLLDFNPLRICSLCLHAGYEYQFAFGFFYNRRRIDETAALKQIAALVGCSRFHRFFCSIRFICDIIMANINKKQNNDRKPGSTPKPVTNRRVINEGVVKNRDCAGYVPKYPTSSDDNSKSNKNTR